MYLAGRLLIYVNASISRESSSAVGLIVTRFPFISKIHAGMVMYFRTLKINEMDDNTNATQYAWCEDSSALMSVISRIDIVTNSAVMTTKLDRLITFAITTIIVGTFTSGANKSIGILPALSTAVVEKNLY